MDSHNGDEKVSYTACLAGMRCKIVSTEGSGFHLILIICEQQQVVWIYKCTVGFSVHE